MSRKPNWPPRPFPHRASGQERLRYRGNEWQLGPIGSAEARAKYAEIIGKLAAGGNHENTGIRESSLTVADVVASWWELEAPRYEERGERRQFTFALRPLLRLHAETPAASFDADALDTVRLSLVGKLARTTINRRTQRICTVWRWAERRGLVPRGSWSNLRSLPGLKKNDRRVRNAPKRQAATWADVLAVAKHLRAPIRDCLLLCWWSGMRQGEARILRPCDVAREGELWYFRPPAHKGTHLDLDRIVVFGPKCRAILAPRLKVAGSQEYLFCSRNGKPYSSNDFARLVRLAARRAGVKLSAHMLRHAYRERCSRAFGDLEHARAALGHASVQQSAAYGSPVDLKLAAEAARKLS